MYNLYYIHYTYIELLYIVMQLFFFNIVDDCLVWFVVGFVLILIYINIILPISEGLDIWHLWEWKHMRLFFGKLNI